MELFKVIQELDAIDKDSTIYAAQPWTENSIAMVLPESEIGRIPQEAVECDLKYFIEVFIAHEFLTDWETNLDKTPTIQEKIASTLLKAFQKSLFSLSADPQATSFLLSFLKEGTTGVSIANWTEETVEHLALAHELDSIAKLTPLLPHGPLREKAQSILQDPLLLLEPFQKGLWHLGNNEETKRVISLLKTLSEESLHFLEHWIQKQTDRLLQEGKAPSLKELLLLLPPGKLSQSIRQSLLLPKNLFRFLQKETLKPIEELKLLGDWMQKTPMQEPLRKEALEWILSQGQKLLLQKEFSLLFSSLLQLPLSLRSFLKEQLLQEALKDPQTLSLAFEVGLLSLSSEEVLAYFKIKQPILSEEQLLIQHHFFTNIKEWIQRQDLTTLSQLSPFLPLFPPSIQKAFRLKCFAVLGLLKETIQTNSINEQQSKNFFHILQNLQKQLTQEKNMKT